MESEFDLPKIVLLYNDRDRAAVTVIRSELARQLHSRGVAPWMASEDMSAFGDLFDNIDGAIATAIGSVVFLGTHGLGRFQQNIEMSAVSIERWLQGSKYGVLLVHLAADVKVPRPLLRWPSVNHDGAIQSAAAIAEAIVRRFDLLDSTAPIDG